MIARYVETKEEFHMLHLDPTCPVCRAENSFDVISSITTCSCCGTEWYFMGGVWINLTALEGKDYTPKSKQRKKGKAKRVSARRTATKHAVSI